MASGCIERGRGAVALLFLLLAALTLRLVFFGGLLAEDDALYWEAARGLRAGDYVRLPAYATRHGVVVPLALFQAWFGENEYAAALASLLYSLGELALAYGLGVLYGGRAVGLVAATLLAVLPLDVIAATDVHRDLPLAALLAAAFYAVKRGELASRRASLWFTLGGAALGLAYLTKEIAIVFAVAFAACHWRRARDWRGAGWFAAAFVATLAGDAAWFGWVTGDPWFRYSPAVLSLYAREGRRLSVASFAWMLDYPSMLMNPLSGHFGYLAGIFYLVLGSVIWGRRDPAVREIAVWWLPPLIVLNFLPLDLTFTRPGAPHFPRYLHPLLVPFALTASLWVVRGLARRPLVRAAALAGFGGLACAGILLAHFDYRIWAAPARQAAAFMARLPADAVVATDPTSTWLLQALAGDARERVVPFAAVDLAAPRRPTFVLRDPILLFSDTGRPLEVPSAVASPPASWEMIAQFPRPARPSLRATVLGWLGARPRASRPSTADSVVLWKVAAPAGSRP